MPKLTQRTRKLRPHVNALEWQVAKLVEHAGLRSVRRGWPDFAVFDHAGRLVMMIEAKSKDDDLTRDQRLVHRLLKAVGIDVRVIRHQDLAALSAELEQMEVAPRPKRRRRVIPPTPESMRALIMGLPSFPSDRS